MQFLYTAMKGALALGVAMLFIGEAKAQRQISDESGTITMTGTVEVIEVPERLITVVGPNGNVVAGIIDVDVKDIKEIKLKETVTIQFTQDVAVAIQKADGPPNTDGQAFIKNETSDMNMNAPVVAEQNWTETTPSGGVSSLTTIEVTDTISAINRRKRTITFAGENNTTRTIQVPQSVSGFSGLEVGDMVVLEITRAVIANVKFKRM
jgi:hypothetical protein